MRALITGISGQDGSYLTELLLSKGYEVFGIIRRHSVAENQQYRLDHLRDDVKVYYGDMTDAARLCEIVREVQPDEIYNLAAQSHVRISFDIPKYTAEVNALGVLNILEAYRLFAPDAKFYQASSSEMFGLSVDEDNFQKESTPMNPTSPYGVAKVYAYNLVRHYRRAYGLHACNGILFNHECISENNPMLIRHDGAIKILRPCDIRRVRPKSGNIQQWSFDNMYIWDGADFVKLLAMTATKRNKTSIDFQCQYINTRNGVIETTRHHNIFNEKQEKGRADSFVVGDKLLHSPQPQSNYGSVMTEEEAEFLGMMVADGNIMPDGSGKFSNNDIELLNRAGHLWSLIALGNYKISRVYKSEYGTSRHISLTGNPRYLRFARDEIYTHDKYKKVPERILNASPNIMLAFLRGYNAGDGLKKNPCVYTFKNFKTNSSVLASGLLYLINNTTKQSYNITIETKNNHIYYSINLLSPEKDYRQDIDSMLTSGESQRETSRKLKISRSTIRKHIRGESVYDDSHLKKDPYEIKKIVKSFEPDWVYDIETESGKFMCGVGNIVVANSPRRGANFVTKKVVNGACDIYLGRSQVLELGNMDSYRDWGHSKDYVRAMHLIINHDPMDFVVATGETHSIRDMCNYVFFYLGLDYRNYVVQNPKYIRPEELPYLRGDATKARIILGWEPEYTFETLLKEMIDDYLQKNTH